MYRQKILWKYSPDLSSLSSRNFSPDTQIRRRVMKIFISYRREDSGHVVLRLCQYLENAFGPANVFYDQSSVSLGGDFRGSVVGSIVMSDVILAVIGPNWARVQDARGRLRLEDRDDPVRMEIMFSLRRNLIPILVDGARMPSTRDLPRALRDITTRSGFRLESGAGFDCSVQELIGRLGGPTNRFRPAEDGVRVPRRNVAWTSFEGNWQTQDGGMTEITQDGNHLELQGYGANGITYRGNGRAENGQAMLHFINSSGMQGQLVLQLIRNGAYISGQLQTYTGTVPFTMMRRG
jgi:TIR domain